MIMFFSGRGVDWEGALVSGRKVHSIRGEGSWRPGLSIEMTVDRFLPTRRRVCVKTCTAVQRIRIDGTGVFVDGARIDGRELELLAVNDGFPDADAFLNYFRSYYKKGLDGVIVHWTENLIYGKEA